MLKDKKVEISKKDYLTFRYFAILYDYTGFATIIWVSLLSLFVLWDYFMTQRSFLIAVLALFMLGSYIKNLFFDVPRTAKEEYDSSTFSNPRYTLSLSENTLKIIRETTTPSVINLKSLYSAFETHYQFCFFLSKNNYLILPKNLLDQDQIKNLRVLIKSLPRANRKNPFSVGLKATLRNVFMMAFITICALLLILSYKIT